MKRTSWLLVAFGVVSLGCFGGESPSPPEVAEAPAQQVEQVAVQSTALPSRSATDVSPAEVARIRRLLGEAVAGDVDVRCELSTHDVDGRERSKFLHGETVLFRLRMTAEEPTTVRFHDTMHPLAPLGLGLDLERDDGARFELLLTIRWHHAPKWGLEGAKTDYEVTPEGTTIEFRFPRYDCSERVVRFARTEGAAKPAQDGADALRHHLERFADASGLIPPGEYAVTFARGPDEDARSHLGYPFTASASVRLRSEPIRLTITK